ncbi:MAG: acyltransferase [Bdellovibrionales bacterium]|nr:acyltransferase [Bdellovibrionales bacterium]
MKERNEAFDLLRGVAIAMVMIHHLHLGALPSWLRESWTGVDLFFVLSGYFVTKSFSGWIDNPGAGATWRTRLGAAFRYILRRMMRILPPAFLWAALSVLAAGFFNRGAGFGNPDQVWQEFLAVLRLDYNYFSVKTGFDKLGYYWSLAVEEHVYVVLPFFLIAVRRPAFRVIGFALVIVTCFALRWIAVDQGASFSSLWYLTHYRAETIAWGSLLAIWNFRGPKIPALFRPGLGLICLGYLWTAPSFLSKNQLGYFGFTTFAVVSALLMTLGANSEIGMRSRFVGAWATLGRRSYSLYLMHIPVWTLVTEILGHGNLALSFLALGVLSEIHYRWVELPLIRLGQRWFF